MKNYFIAFMVSLATIIVLRIISELLNFEISDFMMGWMSCTGFYMTFNELNADEKSGE
jgi:hypothetical protein